MSASIRKNYQNGDNNKSEEPNSNFQEKQNVSDDYTTDSDEFLADDVCNYRKINNVTPGEASTSSSKLSRDKEIFKDKDNKGQGFSNIEIPIVGYEVMEERARFTVYKMQIVNKASGDCWFVFRRYTDFVRLCNRLKFRLPHIFQFLPRKRYLRNNFDQDFLEERANGLQKLINVLLKEIIMDECKIIQDFFCLNEPPIYSEANEESRAILESLKETNYRLKQELEKRDELIEDLKEKLFLKDKEIENLRS